MKHIDPTQLSLAFVHKNCLMFSDLADKLATDTTLAPTRIRDLTSGLRRVAKALGMPAGDVPADPRWLQPRLEKVAPAALGLSLKAWQNVVSDARSAMVHFGIVSKRHSHIDDLVPAWRSLWAIVLASRDTTLQPSLCRFVYFLNRHGVLPADVTCDHAVAFRDALALNEISKSPEVAYRAAVNGWNLAVSRLPEWPRTTILLPQRQKLVKLPPTTFPSSFHKDLARFLGDLRNPNPFEPGARLKPLRASTITQYHRQLVRFASELVHSGVAAAEIDTLAKLVAPSMAERGLRQMLLRNGNQTNQVISDMARLLRNVSNSIDIPENERKQVAVLASRVAMKTQLGMTSKNRSRLRILQDETKQRQLLLLPQRILNRAQGRRKLYTHALAREDALAIAILLVCPLRAKNLAGIHIEKNIHRPGDGRAFLVFNDEEVKNELPIEFELPSDIIRMIDRHLGSRSPELCPSGTPWLFPRRDGQTSIDPNALASRLAKRVRRETGVVMNAHLFRHFAVMLWLDANPGGYEVARLLLGHAALSQTLNMYSGMEGHSATKAFSDLIASKKGARK